jgi:SAM-dependent methyltransferase
MAFYAFLAEPRGAAHVVAVDNEQYVATIRGRFGIHLEPGAGFRAIAELLRSRVDYHRLDALDVERLGETFDVILCFGVLHRVEAPLTLLRVLGECLAPAGRIILETYGVGGRQDDPCVLVHEPGRRVRVRRRRLLGLQPVEPRSSGPALGPAPV